MKNPRKTGVNIRQKLLRPHEVAPPCALIASEQLIGPNRERALQ